MGEAYIYDLKTGECLGQISDEITEIRAENFEREPDEQTEKVLKMTTCAATFELKGEIQPAVMDLLTCANKPWYCWRRSCGALWMFYWFPGRGPEIAYIMTLKQAHIFVNTKKRRTGKKYRKIFYAALAKIK